jgi:hypothetical protein
MIYDYNNTLKHALIDYADYPDFGNATETIYLIYFTNVQLQM